MNLQCVMFIVRWRSVEHSLRNAALEYILSEPKQLFDDKRTYFCVWGGKSNSFWTQTRECPVQFSSRP